MRPMVRPTLPPAGQQVLAAYPASVLHDAPNPRVAAASVADVVSDEARAILADLGVVLP